MKKVLLIDTNVSASPIYEYLKASGYEVFVAGGNPLDFLAKSASNYINVDYADIAAIRTLVNSLSIDFIVPGCNDLSYKTASELNADRQFCGLENIETTDIINRKEQFRNFAERIGLPVPRVITGDEAGKFWPVIVKPVDAYSGRGVKIINKSEKDLLPAAIDTAREYSSSGNYLVEEYVEGLLFSHSAFIRNKKIFIDFIVEEHGTANPFVVDTSRVIYDFPGEMLDRIRKTISLMADHLSLADGLIHTQFIKKNDSFWIIEVTRRCPGDLYSKLIEMSTGFPYAEFYTRPFLGEEIGPSEQSLRRGYIMRHTISQPGESVFGSLKFNLPLNIELFIPLSLSGDTVKASPFGRIGLIFISAESEEKFLSIFECAVKRNLYSLNPGIMNEFEDIISEAVNSIPGNHDTAHLFWSETNHISRYVIGKNSESDALIKRIKIDGVIDDFSETGTTYQNIPVVRSTELPGNAIVVNCSTSISPVSVNRKLAEAGIKKVLTIPEVLYAAEPGIAMPWFVEQMRNDYSDHSAEWAELYRKMADWESRKTFLDIMRYRLTADPVYMKDYSIRQKEQYFEDFLPLGNDVFVDAGGFDGDTTEEFCLRNPGYKKVFLVEPSVTNMKAARERLVNYNHIEFIPLGLSDEPGEFFFNADAGSASSVTNSGGETVQVTTLDLSIKEPVSFIKMDLEGWELKTLMGSKSHLKNDKPKLAIAVYHSASDFRDIPQYILSLNPGYKVFLRHYTEGWSETVMYFVPES